MLLDIVVAPRASSFTDPRDGKVYRTVKIGSQIWMAENLNFNAPGSYCYEDDPVNAEKYGRLYDWDTARKVCPQGWHLPNREEWQELVNFAIGNRIAGKKLKAGSCWNDYNGLSGNGIDAYGFSALPGGYRNSIGSFNGVGYFGYWWAATEYDGCFAYYWYIYYNGEYMYDGLSLKELGNSVRCVKDVRQIGE